MDNSIVIEPVQNIIELSLIKVETLQQLVTPVHLIVERKEVE